MKLVIAGGGGFRVPQIIEVLAAARAGTGANAGLMIDEVALYDVSQARLATMRGVIDGLAYPHAPLVTATTNLREALRGADFVFSAIRVGGTAGRIVDEEVALRLGVLGQETVGPGGYAYAFRTIPVALDLARAVRDVAPEAWVINFTNPAGIITQAMRTVLGSRVVGICDTPIGLVRRATHALGVGLVGIDEVGAVSFDYVGLNHLGWLRSLDVEGVDRLPELLGSDELLDHIEEARVIGPQWVRALGMIPNEYLFYYYLNRESVARIRAEAETRGQFLDRQQAGFYDAALAATSPVEAAQAWIDCRNEREATYMAEAREVDDREGRREEDVSGGGYQQVAMDLMTALATGRPAHMILDVGNEDGAAGSGLLVPQLRADAVVEVPCIVDGSGVVAQSVSPLGGVELGLMTTVKGCEELVIDAALSGDRTLAWRALAGHPLVDSVNVAKTLLEDYIHAEPSIAKVFTH